MTFGPNICLIGKLRDLVSQFWEINGRLQVHESLWFLKRNRKKTPKSSFGDNHKISWNFIKFKGKIWKCWQIVQSSWNYALQIFVCVWNNWHFVRIKITTEIWPSQHQVISHNYWTFLCWRCSRPNPSFLEISRNSLICCRIALNVSHPTAEEDFNGSL